MSILLIAATLKNADQVIEGIYLGVGTWWGLTYGSPLLPALRSWGGGGRRIKWDNIFKAPGTMPWHMANTQQVLLLLAQLSQASLF